MKMVSRLWKFSKHLIEAMLPFERYSFLTLLQKFLKILGFSFYPISSISVVM